MEIPRCIDKIKEIQQQYTDACAKLRTAVVQCLDKGSITSCQVGNAMTEIKHVDIENIKFNKPTICINLRLLKKPIQEDLNDIGEAILEEVRKNDANTSLLFENGHLTHAEA